MPTDNNKSPYKPTGWYAVVHFGTPKDKQSTPCFLKRIPYKSSDGNVQLTYRHFTFNMKEAAIFDGIYAAEKAKEVIVGELTKQNHSLKDHIKVLQLFGLVRERED